LFAIGRLLVSSPRVEDASDMTLNGVAVAAP
jgi:hypothetical protein